MPSATEAAFPVRGTITHDDRSGSAQASLNRLGQELDILLPSLNCTSMSSTSAFLLELDVRISQYHNRLA